MNKKLGCSSVVIWMLIVAFLSLMDVGPAVEMVGKNWIAQLQALVPFGFDKLVHAMMYFVMVVLLAMLKRGWGWLLFAIVFASLFGYFMEICQLIEQTQGWVARCFDWTDVLANTIGAMMGGGFVILARKICDRMRA